MLSPFMKQALSFLYLSKTGKVLDIERYSVSLPVAVVPDVIQTRNTYITLTADAAFNAIGTITLYYNRANLADLPMPLLTTETNTSELAVGMAATIGIPVTVDDLVSAPISGGTCTVYASASSYMLMGQVTINAI